MPAIGTGVGLTFSPPTFRPTFLSGCVLWLRADRGITTASGAVSDWLDQSGSGNHLTQATAGKRPAFTESDANFAGRPSLNFDGTDDALVRASIATGATGDQEWIVVLRSDLDDASERWIAECDTGRLGILWTRSTGNNHGQWTTGGGGVLFGSSSPEADATQDLIWSFSAGGATTRLFEAGVDRGTIAYGGENFGGAFGLGSIFNGAGNHFDGQIAEFIIYNRALAAAERDRLRAYTKARYGY